MTQSKKPPTRKPNPGAGSETDPSGGIVKPLTERQRRFCLAYHKCLNASAAAREAGYNPKIAGQEGSALLKRPQVQNYLRELTAPTEKASIASREERLEILSNLARGREGARPGDRIKAMELLAKMFGEQTINQRVTGAEGGPVEISAMGLADLVALLKEIK